METSLLFPIITCPSTYSDKELELHVLKSLITSLLLCDYAFIDLTVLKRASKLRSLLEQPDGDLRMLISASVLRIVSRNARVEIGNNNELLGEFLEQAVRNRLWHWPEPLWNPKRFDDGKFIRFSPSEKENPYQMDRFEAPPNLDPIETQNLQSTIDDMCRRSFLENSPPMEGIDSKLIDYSKKAIDSCRERFRSLCSLNAADCYKSIENGVFREFTSTRSNESRRKKRLCNQIKELILSPDFELLGNFESQIKNLVLELLQLVGLENRLSDSLDAEVELTLLDVLGAIVYRA
jgi:hypothetical protein